MVAILVLVTQDIDNSIVLNVKVYVLSVITNLFESETFKNYDNV